MTRASIKKAHKLLAPTATLPAMLAVAPMSKVLAAVALVQESKRRAQDKDRKVQTARARRFA